MQQKTVLSFFGEGGSVQIIKTTIENKPAFIIQTEESLHDESSKKSKPCSTFTRAFKAFDKKYNWVYLHLDFVEERYKEILRLKLVEHRQKSSFDEELYQSAERRLNENFSE